MANALLESVMWRALFIAFLITHGWIHLAVWATPKPAGKPASFAPEHSWLLGDQRGLAIAGAIAAMGLLLAAGIGLWARAPWWRDLAVPGLGTSFVLMIVFFHPWFLFIQAVNAALLVGLVWLDWPSKAALGA